MTETQLVPERKFSRNVISVEPLRLKGHQKCSVCGCRIKKYRGVFSKLQAAGLCWNCYFKRKRSLRKSHG